MTKPKYVIRKSYCFDAVADGCRPSSAGSVRMQVKLNHEDAMYMGEYFFREDPYEISDGPDMGIKDVLDERLARQIGWEAVCECYFCWSDDLKEDCVNYFKEHTDKDLDNYDYDDDDELW